ncbi:uncharacterized protein LOC132914584 [Bombus pascuorum]|uniref:uncharacterized protein LOC132914584 n=1 Tax=Bombus pascuorum TaxID=65598 RepID=UPI00298DE51C|nr:uncharacterized protein LOC132914584 [Bombus pascuorum]
MLAKRQSTRDNSIESRRRSSIKESDFFSLNLRILAIRKLQEKDDLYTADASMVWQRLSAGYRIVDLRLNRFMQTLHFVLSYFCRTEPLFKAVGLSDDAVSMKMFMNGVFKQMESMISFCAVKEGTNDLVGVLVASMFEKSQWYIKKELYSIVKHVLLGETLRQVMTLKGYVTAKARTHELMNVGGLVWIDILCVKPEHRNNGIGTALVRSCMARASYFATACAGQFTSGAAQTIGTFRFVCRFATTTKRFASSFE